MSIHLRRRDFIAALGGVAAWPLAAGAQQQRNPIIGFLDRGSPGAMTTNLAGFHKGLAENGYTENKNLRITYRWAESQDNRLAALAAELVRLPVAVIAATRTSAPALAAKAATSTIPIVFQTGSDPVKDGLVASFNRPGGNVTGVARISAELIQKRLGLILELVPKATTVGLLTNPNNNIESATQVMQMQDATRARGLSLYVAKASNDRELDGAIAAMARAGVAALVEGNDTLFLDRRKQLAALTISYRIPAIFFEREAVADGGLMSYDASLADSFRQVGDYVGRILKGEKPANLPVVQPTKFDLVINLTTARAISFEISPTLLAIADEVIE
jgi:putative ABC transport system substrate-binding protein